MPGHVIPDTGEVLDWRDAKRAAVVAAARGEIGDQTKGHPQVTHYWRTVCPQFNAAQIAQLSKKQEWCGIFALWCLHQAGVTSAPWELGRGFAYRLERTHTPEPGDVFVGPGPLWHHGIVESLTIIGAKPWLASIEGNTPDVRRRDRPAPAGFAYYSISPWLRAILDES